MQLSTYSPTQRRAEAVALGILILIVAVIAARLPYGIDLSDESYYAIFVDDWLKGGIRSSTLVTLHQTAELLVYPAARLFAAVTGGSDGLVFFLRCCFLFDAVLAATIWFLLLRRTARLLVATMGAGLVLAFIPFGLPAPSYNTLGQHALYIALGSFGMVSLGSKRPALWITISALGWAAAVIAYPLLAGPLIACLILYVIRAPTRRSAGTYAAAVFGAQCLAWFMVVLALSPARLIESIQYHFIVVDVGGLERKLDFARTVLKEHPVFLWECGAAILLGLFRDRIGAISTALLTGILVVGAFTAPAALFCTSHDVVVLLALTGSGLAFRLGGDVRPTERITAEIWVISMIAGAVTMVTAFNSIYNFCIGAAPAAVVALASLRTDTRLRQVAVLVSQGVALAALLFVSLTFHYGDLPASPPPRQLVTWGAFKGLYGQPVQVTALEQARDAIVSRLGPCRCIAFFGRIYGLLLVVPARALQPEVFPLDHTMNPVGIALTHHFFERAENRPDLVVTYRDGWFDTVNPMEPEFDDRYEEAVAMAMPLGPDGELRVYRLRAGR